MKNFFRISFLIALFFGFQFNSNAAEIVEYLKTDWSFKVPSESLTELHFKGDIKFIKKFVLLAIL